MLNVQCILIVVIIGTQLPLKSLSTPLNVIEKNKNTDVNFKDVKISNTTDYAEEAQNTNDKNNEKDDDKISSSFSLLKREMDTIITENITEKKEPLAEPIHKVVKNEDTSNNAKLIVNTEELSHADIEYTTIMNASNPSDFIKNEESINYPSSNIFQKPKKDDKRNDNSNETNETIVKLDDELTKELIRPVYEKNHSIIPKNLVNENIVDKTNNKISSENIYYNIITESENDNILIPDTDSQIKPISLNNNSIKFEVKKPMEETLVEFRSVNIIPKQDNNISSRSIMPETKTILFNSDNITNKLGQFIEATSIQPVLKLNIASPIYVDTIKTIPQKKSHKSNEYFEDSIKSLQHEKAKPKENKEISPENFTSEKSTNALIAEMNELMNGSLINEILNDDMSINIVSKEDFREMDSFTDTNFKKTTQEINVDEINKHITQATRKVLKNIETSYIGTEENITEVSSVEFIPDNVSIIIPSFQAKIKELVTGTTILDKNLFYDDISSNNDSKGDSNGIVSANLMFRKAFENNDLFSESIPVNVGTSTNSEITSIKSNSKQENINTPTTTDYNFRKDHVNVSDEAVTVKLTEDVIKPITENVTKHVTESVTQTEATATYFTTDNSVDMSSTEKGAPAQAISKKGYKKIFLEKIIGGKHKMSDIDIEATFSRKGIRIQPALVRPIDSDSCNDTSATGQKGIDYVFIIEGKSPTKELTLNPEFVPRDVIAKPSPPQSCCSGSVCYSYCNFLNPQPLLPMIVQPPPVVVPYSAYFQRAIHDSDVLAEAPYHSDSPIFLSSFESDSSVEVESS